MQAPAAAPASATALGDTVETFRLFRDITNDLKEEQKAQQPAAAAPAADPVTTGLAIAEKFMAMKADNPMLEVMKTMLEDRRLELAAERERGERLQAELRSKETAKTGPTGLGFVKELIGEIKGLLPDLKDVFPGFGEKISGAARAPRSNMSGEQEFWLPIVTRALDAVAPVAPMLIQRAMAPKQPQPPAPGSSPALPAAAPGAPAQPAPPGPPQPPTIEVEPAAKPPQFEFIKTVAPVLMNYLRDGMTGAEFAEWIFNGYGPEFQGLSWVAMKGAIGAGPIVEMFKQSPYWQELSLIETKFTAFVEEFVAWQPGQPEGDLTEVEAN
jgi:hypothetical protein